MYYIGLYLLLFGLFVSQLLNIGVRVYWFIVGFIILFLFRLIVFEYKFILMGEDLQVVVLYWVKVYRQKIVVDVIVIWREGIGDVKVIFIFNRLQINIIDCIVVSVGDGNGINVWGGKCSEGGCVFVGLLYVVLRFCCCFELYGIVWVEWGSFLYFQCGKSQVVYGKDGIKFFVFVSYGDVVGVVIGQCYVVVYIVI